MVRSKPQQRCALAAVLAAVCVGCGGSPTTTARSSSPAPQEWRARATLEGRSGATVTGTATFTQVGQEPVRVHVRVAHAMPGLHGLHVHETGDCSDPGAQTTGNHLDPRAAAHAGLDAQTRHAGDLGNIEVREDGTGDLVAWTSLLTVQAGEASVVGRAVVFHAGQDDLVTQPSGDSGARQACGVVVAERR